MILYGIYAGQNGVMKIKRAVLRLANTRKQLRTACKAEIDPRLRSWRTFRWRRAEIHGAYRHERVRGLRQLLGGNCSCDLFCGILKRPLTVSVSAVAGAKQENGQQQ